MKRQIVLLAALVFGLLAAPSAFAQATRTWVSGVGDDANPCSRTAPCKTFAGAISKTAAGGEIDTLDPGGFGAVTITKAITIANEGVGEAGVAATGINGIVVNCSTDPTCVVILRGLIIDGGPIGSNSLAGVKFIAGKVLAIQNCAIRNFTGGSPNGYGVQFVPGGSQGGFGLVIENTTISTNGVGVTGSGSGGGVLVAPANNTPANFSIILDHVQIIGNNAGLRADNTNGTGAIGVTVSNSVISGNANSGVAAISTSLIAPVAVEIDHSTVSHNGSVALNSSGPGSTVRFGTSTIAVNLSAFKTNNGGTLTTDGDNHVFDNGSVGSTPTSAPAS